MAKIIENKTIRRIIKLSTDDVINIVREYQNLNKKCYTYKEIRALLDTQQFYLPEDLF